MIKTKQESPEINFNNYMNLMNLEPTVAQQRRKGAPMEQMLWEEVYSWIPDEQKGATSRTTDYSKWAKKLKCNKSLKHQLYPAGKEK